MKTQTSFERFEYKYWTSEKNAEQLMRQVGPYLRCDDWQPGGQRNTSLYLDSPDLDFMQLHVESSPDRFKLRVRAYGDPPVDPAFLEIKRKVKAVCFKRRVVVPLGVLPQLLAGETLPALPGMTAEEEKTLSQFLYLMMVYQAEPKALLTCRREAYTAREPSDQVRLTLDREVCYQPTHGYSLQGDPGAWIRLCGLGNNQPEASTLIELKFRGVAPWWVQEAVQRLHLTLSAYSKYVSAMALEEMGAGGLCGLDLAERNPPAAAVLGRV